MSQQAAASLDSPVSLMSPRGQDDPELVALAPPPKYDKMLAVALMSLTVLMSAAMCWSLRSEVAYAFQEPVPQALGELVHWQPDPRLANHYVRASVLLGTKAAIRYERPFEGDSFRLHAVAGNPKVWVEIRVPEGMEGPRFVPPVHVVGRLVPWGKAGLRHGGVASAVEKYAGKKIPDDAWLLVDGASPRASRWAVALAALFALFGLWNIVQLVRILRPIKS